MAFSKPVLAAMFLFMMLDKYAESIEAASSNSNEDTAPIPMIASGKRQHNIMRFGKRPAEGHNLLRFGKRDYSKPPQHSFLSFGKRLSDQTPLPDLIQYLQNANDKSYKRGHTIMRFGKRSPYDAEDDYGDYYPDDSDIDEMKRGGHNMMYFGKRGGPGHSMMYFGKRAGGHNMLSFGKRDDDKRAHSMIHFGKREDDDENDLPLEDKRAHSMIHFGKRESDDYDDSNMEVKRAAHSMIHFGKREFDPELLPYWNPNTYEKKQHNLLRFGKKMDGFRKGSHAMIHFGKRDDDKRAAHSMIHFGKRSVDPSIDSASNNQSGNGPAQQGPRVKRDLEDSVRSAEPLIVYGNHEDEDLSPDEELENSIKGFQPSMYPPSDIIDHLSYPDEEQLISFYPDYRLVNKKEASKNVFLRFG